MAIYHLSVKPISRSAGRSATAAAAYRSAERILDETTGETFDYSRKRGVEHSEIVLPTLAVKQDIQWARDRQQLWNAAEFAEKRKDSRVAREYEVALPHELTKAQRREFVQRFSLELANRYGIAVDFSIHQPDRAGDQRNFHAHILTTTRQLTPTGLGAKASIEWSDTDRARHGMGPAKEEVKAVRERWAAHTNAYLIEHGIEERIDHRTLVAQGMEREATSHLGPAVQGMQRRGLETEVGQRIRWELQAAAQRRFEHVAVLGRVGELERQIDQALVVLNTSLSTALKLQSQGQTISAIELRQRQAAENWLLDRIDQAEQTVSNEPSLAHRRELDVELEPQLRPDHGLEPGGDFDGD